MVAAAVHTALCLSDLGVLGTLMVLPQCETAGLDTNTSRGMAGGRLAGYLCVLPRNSQGYPSLWEWPSPESEAKANVLLCCAAPIFTRE